MTMPIGLPISWAIPADNRPTEANFSARMISSWAFFNSRLATSRELTVERSFSLSADMRRSILFKEADNLCNSLSSLRTEKSISSSS